MMEKLIDLSSFVWWWWWLLPLCVLFLHSCDVRVLACSAVMTGGHLVCAGFLLWQASKLHHTGYSQDGIKHFYRFIWNLFYAEYLMYPFI